jgi:hypothetical protein
MRRRITRLGVLVSILGALIVACVAFSFWVLIFHGGPSPYDFVEQDGPAECFVIDDKTAVLQIPVAGKDAGLGPDWLRLAEPHGLAISGAGEVDEPYSSDRLPSSAAIKAMAPHPNGIYGLPPVTKPGIYLVVLLTYDSGPQPATAAGVSIVGVGGEPTYSDELRMDVTVTPKACMVTAGVDGAGVN